MTKRSNLMKDHKPELVDELVDPDLARVLTYGSNRLVDWRCNKGHVWREAVKTRVRGSKCPVCHAKRTQPGLNDLDSTHPELASQLTNRRLGRRLTANSRTMAKWRCDRGHEWAERVMRRVNGATCPKCDREQYWADVLGTGAPVREIED